MSLVKLSVLGGLVLLGLSLVAKFCVSLGPLPETTRVLADDGSVIATIFDENRKVVSLDQIPPHLREAILATEGHYLTGRVARTVAGAREPTLGRQAEEALTALALSKSHTEAELLEYVLNATYFGSESLGVWAASDIYFKKHPSKLKLWQSALLAGLPQAPSRFSPFEDREAALERTEDVLNALQLEPTEVSSALTEAEAYKFQRRDPLRNLHPGFQEVVQSKLAARFTHQEIRRGGLTVHTTLHLPFQELALTALQDATGDTGLNGAVVIVDQTTGDLKALVGEANQQMTPVLPDSILDRKLSLLQLAELLTAASNKGISLSINPVRRVTDPYGRVVYTGKQTRKDRFEPSIAKSVVRQTSNRIFLAPDEKTAYGVSYDEDFIVVLQLERTQGETPELRIATQHALERLTKQIGTQS